VGGADSAFHIFEDEGSFAADLDAYYVSVLNAVLFSVLGCAVEMSLCNYYALIDCDLSLGPDYGAAGAVVKIAA
jgi:uncharacterized membrane protein